VRETGPPRRDARRASAAHPTKGSLEDFLCTDFAMSGRKRRSRWACDGLSRQCRRERGFNAKSIFFYRVKRCRQIASHHQQPCLFTPCAKGSVHRTGGLALWLQVAYSVLLSFFRYEAKKEVVSVLFRVFQR